MAHLAPQVVGQTSLPAGVATLEAVINREGETETLRWEEPELAEEKDRRGEGWLGYNYQILVNVRQGEVDRTISRAAACQVLSQAEERSRSALAVVGGGGDGTEVAQQVLLRVQPGALYHQERAECCPAKQLDTFKVE